MTDNCLIIGSGHAAAMLAPMLRQQGWAGAITVVTEEPVIPYQRPPLSKDFLAGEKSLADIYLRPASVYEQAEIDFVLNKRITAIHPAAKTITCMDGEQLAYTRLVLTVGARVRTVDLPGATLAGVCYLRDLADAEQIRQHIQPGGHAVIVGGGYIGLESAAVLNRLGMQVRVLEMQARVLQRVTAPEVSAFYTRIHREEGVDIRCNTAVSAFHASPGTDKVAQVICDDGTTLAADLVVIGVGIVPNTELAEAAGLAVENGIKVNSQAQTSDPSIYAAGDCTCHYNPVYDRWLRLESVQNAAEQAHIAALAICGKPEDYHALPWFWSDQYDLKLQIAGLSQGYDQVVIRGDITNSRRFAAFYLRQGRIIAVDAVNKPPEFMFSKTLIMQGASMAADKLADESIPMKALMP